MYGQSSIAGSSHRDPESPLRLSESVREIGSSPLALSPDGETLVYKARGDEGDHLFRRPIDQFEATVIPDTVGVFVPFFSSDGQWVGFVAEGELRKVALSGGPAQTLTTLPAAIRGASWGPDDQIVFAVNVAGGALMQVSGGGGEARLLFTPEAPQRPWYPQVLPKGGAVLFTLLEQIGPDAGDLSAASCCIEGSACA